MRLQTQTPLGSMANAARDNFERAQFVGYDPRMVRFFQFTLSGFFAGIAGGLVRHDLRDRHLRRGGRREIGQRPADDVYRRRRRLLGPILGAVLMVLLQSGSASFQLWLLYVGVLFILMVIFAPGGLIGLVFVHVPIWRSGRASRLAAPYARILVPGLLVLLGFVLLVELCRSPPSAPPRARRSSSPP